ncbi:TetR/AcrR family transcriptional regulator [Paenibacillus rhizoplanae]
MTRKEQIIKTAMQLFAVKGSSSTSMQEIAELCGISKGSLYLIFKSKEELERSIYIYCFRMIHDPPTAGGARDRPSSTGEAAQPARNSA